MAEIEAGIEDGSITMEPDLRRAITQAGKLNAESEMADEEEQRLQNRYEGLVAEQSRLHDNLKEVSQEALRARYLKALDQTETQIGENFDRLDRIRQHREVISAELLALFGDL